MISLVDIRVFWQHGSADVNVKLWISNNTYCCVLSILKTKELVFHRPCPRSCHMGSPIVVLNE